MYFQYVLNVSLFPHSIDIYEHLLHAGDIAVNKTDMVHYVYEADTLVREMTKKYTRKQDNFR